MLVLLWLGSYTSCYICFTKLKFSLIINIGGLLTEIEIMSVPCFYRVKETHVEVWENEKCWGTRVRAVGECFHSFFEFSQTSRVFL